MKKAKLVFLLLMIMVLSMSFTGCEYFWPSDNGVKVVLPPKVVSNIFNYNTVAVKKGTVKKVRSITATFMTSINYNNQVMTLPNLSLVCSVTTDQYNLFQKNDKGTIVLDNTVPNTPQYGKNITYNAQITAVPDVYSNFTSFVVQIIGDYDTNMVKEGTLATFQIMDEQKDNVLVIPKAAVKNYLSRSYVGILKNGTEEDTMISVGLSGTDSVEVLSGLSVGELVILN